MTPAKGGLIYVLLIVVPLTILISGGAYLYNQNKQSGTVAAISSLQTEAWTPYQDEAVGIRFQYPSAWDVPHILNTDSSNPSLNPYTITMGMFNIVVSTTTPVIPENVNREEMTIGGVSAIKIFFPDEPEMFKGTKSVIIPLSNRVVVITYADSGSDAMNQLYEEVIKSIEFIRR